MPPLTLLIKPASLLCNLASKYCFYADVVSYRQIKSHGMMTEQTLEIMAKNAVSYGTKDITFAFQGGKPTL